MKRWACMFLLVTLLISQFQVWVLYADSVASLGEAKQENIEKLEVIDTTIEKIDKKINNTEIEARLEQKEAEVEEYL